MKIVCIHIILLCIQVFIMYIFAAILIATSTSAANETSIPEHRPTCISKQPNVDSDPVLLKQNPHKLKVRSTVQHGDPVKYGVVKWIGILPGKERTLYAGVEMVSYVKCNIHS